MGSLAARPWNSRYYESSRNEVVHRQALHLLDLGVDCFKTDFGERIPHIDVKYFDGSDPMRMHNAYAVLYNDVVFTLLEKRFGKHEAGRIRAFGCGWGTTLPRGMVSPHF